MNEEYTKNSDEKFHVYQFFEDGSYERVREFVGAEQAMLAVNFYTKNVSARIGTTRRVIITDMGDMTCFEWKYGEGVVFPTKEDFEQMRKEGI